MHLCVYVCAHICMRFCENQKTVLNPLNQSHQSHQCGFGDLHDRSSGRAVGEPSG